MTPANGLTEDDIGFVDQCAELFYSRLAWDVLTGSAVEINGVINYFDNGKGAASLDMRVHDYVSHYNGPLLADVQKACKAYADKMAATPKTAMDRLYALFGRDRQSRYTKLYQQYLAR